LALIGYDATKKELKDDKEDTANGGATECPMQLRKN